MTLLNTSVDLIKQCYSFNKTVHLVKHFRYFDSTVYLLDSTIPVIPLTSLIDIVKQFDRFNLIISLTW